MNIWIVTSNIKGKTFLTELEKLSLHTGPLVKEILLRESVYKQNYTEIYVYDVLK